jgi:hypothetical protein
MLLNLYPQRMLRKTTHAAKQALSHLVVAAALRELDSTPLEGFDADAWMKF